MKYKPMPISPPFFEIGPKTYLYGAKMLALALSVDQASEITGVRVILTPQYVDIPAVVRETKNVYVFAQHMDPCLPGRGVGAVLAESLKEAGAHGVLLNHAERKMTLHDLGCTIARARETGLASMVCADNLTEALAAARFAPDIILVEPEVLIGTSEHEPAARGPVVRINEEIKRINSSIQILHGGGIASPEDAAAIIRLGADATGCTSAIICAEDPAAAAWEMLWAVHAAWEEQIHTGGKHGSV
jgi:triosephosphate isomerase